MSTIISFDPGGTTGYSVWDDSKGKWELLEAGTITEHKGAEQLIVKHRVSVVVCEKVFVKSASFNPIGLKVGGIIEYVCDMRKIKFVWQIPSAMTGPKRFLRKLLKQFSTEHERDAICHAVAYLGVERLPSEYITTSN